MKGCTVPPVNHELVRRGREMTIKRALREMLRAGVRGSDLRLWVHEAIAEHEAQQ